MISSNAVKGFAIVVLLLIALGAFDTYNNYANSQITGAAVLTDGGSQAAVQNQQTSCRFDLSAYPCMFVISGAYSDFDGVIVVGDQASREDTAEWYHIANSLEYLRYAPTRTKPASQVVGTSQNVISIGGACSNQMTSNLLGNPANCVAGLRNGMGVIKLVRQPNGKAAVIVMGYGADDTKRASLVLANFIDWQAAGKLRGDEVVVTGTGLISSSIAVFESEKSFNPNAGGGLYAGLTYTCYDETGGGVGVNTLGNCIGYDEMREVAELNCLGHCYSDMSKCGVNNLKFNPCGATDQTALPDINITLLRLENRGSQIGVYYAVNNTGDSGITTPFYVITRLKGWPHPEGVIRNVTIEGLKAGQQKTGGYPGFADYFTFDASRSRCGADVVQVSADDSGMIAEKDETNNREEATVPCKSNEIEIGTGWNMISVNALQNLVSTTCSRNKINDNVFAFFPQEGMYGRYRLSSNFKSFGAIRGELYDVDEKEDSERLKNTYPFPGAVWLHNNGDACSLKSTLKPQAGTIPLSAGWNMISVPSAFKGKTLADFFGNCNVKFAYDYRPSTDWREITLDTVFSEEDAGRGIWLNVAEACQAYI